MSLQSVLEFAGRSDTGLVRAQNEDAFEICEDLGLAVLADGMGGYNAGEVASRMCVELIAQFLQQKQQAVWMPIFSRPAVLAVRWLNDAITLANTRVYNASHENEAYLGMGTTAVVALSHQDKLLVAHVGDSRAYRFRNGELSQITRDHSVLQAQIDAGLISEKDARFSPIKNLITRAVGAQENIEIEIHVHQMEVGDVYLLCSDGLTDMLNHIEIHHIMHQYNSQLEKCCEVLINSANQFGGRDNISVVLVKVTELHQRKLMEHIFAS
ncbi:Stp1/IreP family PP2C-type Ser/Thr phosphatase [Undibacterium sp. Ren11W]|uniref:Stp1/IreP family PP2C-type Ser/Thr phosphatase n=1 Tax=Undibacterium sp. Ren11W TaxID=3413045 RepID=UPI003BF28948